MSNQGGTAHCVHRTRDPFSRPNLHALLLNPLFHILPRTRFDVGSTAVKGGRSSCSLSCLALSPGVRQSARTALADAAHSVTSSCPCPRCPSHTEAQHPNRSNSVSAIIAILVSQVTKFLDQVHLHAFHRRCIAQSSQGWGAMCPNNLPTPLNHSHVRPGLSP